MHQPAKSILNTDSIPFGAQKLILAQSSLPGVIVAVVPRTTMPDFHEMFDIFNIECASRNGALTHHSALDVYYKIFTFQPKYHERTKVSRNSSYLLARGSVGFC